MVLIIIISLYFLISLLFDYQIKTTLNTLEKEGYPKSIKEIAPKRTQESEEAKEILSLAHSELKNREEIRLADSIEYEENPRLFRKVAGDNIKAIGLLLKAAEYPHFYFGIDYEKGFRTEIDELAISPHFPSLLRIYAKKIYEEGKSDSALKILGKALKLASMVKEPYLIYHLYKVRSLRKTLKVIQEFSRKGDLNTLKDLVNTIENLKMREEMREALIGQMLSNNISLSQSENFSEYLPKKRFFLFLLNLLPIRRYIQLKTLQLMKREIEIVRDPYFIGREACDHLPKEIGKMGIFKPLIINFVPNPKIFYLNTESFEAEKEITILGLKIFIHKRKTGKLPKELKEVTDKVLLDPFTGKGYIYKLLPEGVLIYSVGKDGIDDNGEINKDIVWKIGI